MKSQRKWIAWVMGWVLVLGAVGGVASAGTEGRINGQVMDPAGNPLEGVNVTISAIGVDMSRAAESNKKGKFSLTVLNAGRDYEIRLELEGYQILEEPIDLKVGGMIKPEYTLTPGQTVTPEQLAELESRDKSAKLYNQGAEKFGGGQIDEAIELFKASLVEKPDQGLAHLALARIYVAKGDDATALPHAEKADELVPDEELSQVVLFDALWGQGMVDRALPLLDRMLESDKASDKLSVRVFNAGVHSVKAGDMAAAKARFERALELDDRIYQAHIPLAQIAINEQRAADAVDHAESFLAKEPEASKALSVLYQAHLANGDEAAAQAAFDRLSAADPELVVQTFFEEGVTHFNDGRNAAAISAFESVLKADPDYARAHYYLGLCSASGGDIGKAKQHLSRFIELAPEDPEAGVAREMLSGLG